MITVEKLLPDQWKYLSEDAHLIAFCEKKPAELDRISYALLAVEGSTPLAYVTVRETSAETVYWQFGGSFPSAKGTLKSFLSYQAFIAWTKERHKRVTTLIENDNIPMLKFAMKVGFRIAGLRVYNGSVLLEHLIEF